MKNKLILLVVLLTAFVVKAQSKWGYDLVVKYEMTDEKEETVNYIEIKKDSVLYEWTDKKKPMKRKFVMDVEMENKVLKAMSDNKVMKFKSKNLAKGQKNIVFTYLSIKKTKVVVFPSPIKPNSIEEKFIKEFLEPILVKVFEQEIKNYPR